jgi:hypothetical protein
VVLVAICSLNSRISSPRRGTFIWLTKPTKFGISSKFITVKFGTKAFTAPVGTQPQTTMSACRLLASLRASSSLRTIPTLPTSALVAGGVSASVGIGGLGVGVGVGGLGVGVDIGGFSVGVGVADTGLGLSIPASAN